MTERVLYPEHVFSGWDLPRSAIEFLIRVGLPRECEAADLVFGYASGEPFTGSSAPRPLQSLWEINPVAESLRRYCVIGRRVGSAELVCMRVPDGRVAVADEIGLDEPRPLNESVALLSACLDELERSHWETDDDGSAMYERMLKIDPTIERPASDWRLLLRR